MQLKKIRVLWIFNNTRRYIDVITASKLTFKSLQKKYENKFLNLVGKESIKI